MLCPKCHTEYEGDSCPTCEAQPSTNPYAADPFPADAGQTAPVVEQQGDATGGLIPYKNPKALIAYYLGILSGLPMIGLPFGVAAFVLGIQGLRDRKRNPIIKGSIHAGIGIGCGGIFTLLWSVIIVGLIFAAFTS